MAVLTDEVRSSLMNELVNLDEIAGELSEADNFKVEMRRLKIKELLRDAEEVEVEVPAAKAVKAPKAKAPKKEKAPRITKQSKANAIVARFFAGKQLSDVKNSKVLKAEAILAIQNEVGMTKAGATTYFYNALKVV